MSPLGAALPSVTGTQATLTTPIPTSQTSPTTTSPAPYWPTAVLPKFPLQFKDIPDSALSCWKAWGNYQLRTQLPNPGIIANATTSAYRSPLATPITVIEDYSYCSAIVNQSLVGLITLCDGVPRAYGIERSTSWAFQPWIINYTQTDTWADNITPGTTLAGYENEQPDCRIAPNSVPLCDEVNSAYTWWLSSHGSQTPPPVAASTTATPTKSVIETLAAPDCIQFVPVPAHAKPTCAMEVAGEELWYWPAPAPNGSDFCNSNWIAPTATPTIPGKPNTAVVSGMTLTSPSVYHFIKTVNVYTIAGTNRKADGGAIRQSTIWQLSTTLPTDKAFLTDKQLETDILSVTYVGPKHPHAAATFSYNKDFRVNDIFTMRSAPFFGSPENKGISTIIQNEVTHQFALPISEIVAQNQVFKQCEWTRTYTRDVYPSDSPLAVMNMVPAHNFHAIVTGPGGPTAPPAQTSTADVRPPSPPLCKP